MPGTQDWPTIPVELSLLTHGIGQTASWKAGRKPTVRPNSETSKMGFDFRATTFEMKTEEGTMSPTDGGQLVNES